MTLLVQVVAWYVVCNGIKCTCCHRPNLVDLPEEQVLDIFRNEMAPWHLPIRGSLQLVEPGMVQLGCDVLLYMIYPYPVCHLPFV